MTCPKERPVVLLEHPYHLIQKDSQRLSRSASHRDKISQHFTHGCQEDRGRALIMGFGDGTTINLHQIEKFFREVHLLDWDGTGLLKATEAHKSSKTQIGGGLDFCGVTSTLSRWSLENPPSRGEIEDCIRKARDWNPPEAEGPFEFTLSSCLLSQIIHNVNRALLPDHPYYKTLINAVVQRHLELLVNATGAGGVGLLVTDFVSSDQIPALRKLQGMELAGTLAKALERHQVIYGANPLFLHQQIKKIPFVKQSQLLLPWVWDTGRRQHAVTGIKFQLHPAQWSRAKRT